MVGIDAALAKGLVTEQFPHWAYLLVSPVDKQGWDNRTFRLGDDMKLRLPAGPGYAAQVEKEARWLPVLAAHLPVEVPTPVAVGEPGLGYPYRWAVQSWIAGTSVADGDADVTLARDVARFLSALRSVESAGGPLAGAHSFQRGGDLRVYDMETRAAVAALGDAVDASRALAVWDAALASAWSSEPVWVHGDVAAGNLLVNDGRLHAVIDFGCLAVGDPACDLVAAWTLFSGEAREVFRGEVGLDGGTWARARGWALWKALITLETNRADLGARGVIEVALAEAG